MVETINGFVTHWDEDHYQGISDLISTWKKASEFSVNRPYVHAGPNIDNEMPSPVANALYLFTEREFLVVSIFKT
jgi:hypothetical protein